MISSFASSHRRGLNPLPLLRRLPPPPARSSPPAAAAALLVPSASVSSLKVPWRKDRILDAAIERDKPWRLCARVVREVLLEPGRSIPVRYLEKRRARLRLPVRVPTFLAQHPNLFELYPDRIKPSSPQPVPFLRPSPRLLAFLADEAALRSRHQPLAAAKLAKLLMISRHRVIPAEKLFNVKRDFGLPDDFLVTLVPQYPNLFRLTGRPGEEKSHLELVSWDDSLAKSAIERRAEEESQLAGVGMRPNFAVRLPPGFYLKKEMREWIRDWLEMPYVSPYADASALQPASPEMEKRNVAVLHELLSLTVLKRMAVPSLGKFCEEYRLSNAFANAFTRHAGIFYASLKGGIQTAMLREAYDGRGELVDRDPLLEIKEKFVEMMEEGRREYSETMKAKREAMKKDLELMARKNAELCEEESSENAVNL